MSNSFADGMRDDRDYIDPKRVHVTGDDMVTGVDKEFDPNDYPSDDRDYVPELEPEDTWEARHPDGEPNPDAIEGGPADPEDYGFGSEAVEYDIMSDIADMIEPLERPEDDASLLRTVADYLDANDAFLRKWAGLLVRQAYGSVGEDLIIKVFTPKPGDSVQEDLRQAALRIEDEEKTAEGDPGPIETETTGGRKS